MLDTIHKLELEAIEFFESANYSLALMKYFALLEYGLFNLSYYLRIIDCYKKLNDDVKVEKYQKIYKEYKLKSLLEVAKKCFEIGNYKECLDIMIKYEEIKEKYQYWY